MKFSIYFFSLLIASIFFSCGRSSKSNDPSRFYLKKFNLSLKKPFGWDVVPNYQGSIPVLYLSQIEDSTDNFRENIYLSLEENVKENRIGDFYKTNLATLKSTTNMFSIVSEGDNENASEKNRWLTYNYTAENQTFTVLAYIYLVDNMGVVISCTGTPESFDRYKPIFEEIASSLQEE